jgi:hypothetical protein
MQKHGMWERINLALVAEHRKKGARAHAELRDCRFAKRENELRWAGAWISRR